MTFMCSTMQFRQRVAWLLMAAYLLMTAGALYYLFEISTSFSLFALEYAKTEHDNDGSLLRRRDEASIAYVSSVDHKQEETDYLQSASRYIADVPAPVLYVLLLVFYVQVFCMLWSCTRPEVNCVTIFWPICVYSHLVALQHSISKSVHRQQRGGLLSSLIRPSNRFSNSATYNL